MPSTPKITVIRPNVALLESITAVDILFPSSPHFSRWRQLQKNGELFSVASIIIMAVKENRHFCFSVESILKDHWLLNMQIGCRTVERYYFKEMFSPKLLRFTPLLLLGSNFASPLDFLFIEYVIHLWQSI